MWSVFSFQTAEPWVAYYLGLKICDLVWYDKKLDIAIVHCLKAIVSLSFSPLTKLRRGFKKFPQASSFP